MKKTTVYVFDFVVEGRGTFPLDMLRYDQAVPLTSEDAVTISGDALDSVAHAYRTVRLRRFSVVDKGPTIGRWASFGWQVAATPPDPLASGLPPLSDDPALSAGESRPLISVTPGDLDSVEPEPDASIFGRTDDAPPIAELKAIKSISDRFGEHAGNDRSRLDAIFLLVGFALERLIFNKGT